MKIAFIWQGFDGRYGAWNDGLRAAMSLIGLQHTVRYFDFPLDAIHDFNPDYVLYWEAPCTLNGKDAPNYRAVQQLPYRKALLFAGGPIQKHLVDGFELLFVESKINEDECAAMSIPFKRAFGVNDSVFRPMDTPKVYDGAFQATCASWKRHWLLADALQGKAVICGRDQTEDPIGFIRAREAGAHVLPELPATEVAKLINASHTVVNCSDFWGGGQRCTLEAMACNVPVIVMDDSPKNREYVEESGAGIVCKPEPSAIKKAVDDIKAWTLEEKSRGIAYINSKWTSKHYADAIISGLI